MWSEGPTQYYYWIVILMASTTEMHWVTMTSWYLKSFSNWIYKWNLGTKFIHIKLKENRKITSQLVSSDVVSFAHENILYMLDNHNLSL
jgi:uncharacterized membrane protein AbrB (regulator of aidB expression)